MGGMFISPVHMCVSLHVFVCVYTHIFAKRFEVGDLMLFAS